MSLPSAAFLCSACVLLCLCAQAATPASAPGGAAGPLSAPSASADAPQRVFTSIAHLDELIRLGMPGLAMRQIEQQQKLYPVYSRDWYTFEFKRIETLVSIEDWNGVIEHAGTVLQNADADKAQITAGIANWLGTQLAIALLNAGEPERALAQSRRMLWTTPDAALELVQLWRRLVIRAYLQLGLTDDAQKSLMKYEQDYGELSAELRLLQARSLLRDGRLQDVITLLAGDDSHASRALTLVAALRAEPRRNAAYAKEARKLLEDGRLNDAQRRAYLYVLYEAALQQRDLVAAAGSLEQILSLSRTGLLPGDEFALAGDDLWQLYEHIGREAGNGYGLLLGDDGAWLARAGDEAEPERACGLYTVVALSTTDESTRKQAHEHITRLLADKDNGLEIINQLYLHSTLVDERGNIPEGVRYRLVDYALSIGDVSLAAGMMATLARPPPEQDGFNWQVHKARVLILEGRHEEGERELQASLAGRHEFDKEMVDRYLQVVFDLQTIDRHRQALEMFDLLPDAQLDESIRRELYYWKAESNFALKRYDHAAWLYLKSAATGDETMTDRWAQSARFKAAEALLEAGLFDDASHAYTQLLAITDSDSRRRLIRQKLQHIRLIGNAAVIPANAAQDAPAAPAMNVQAEKPGGPDAGL